MRRALEYAVGARHHARPALRGRRADQGRGDARGVVLQPPRPARLAGDRRGADGPPRHRAVPAHRRAGSTCCTCRRRGSVELVRAAKADGLPVTAEAAPHHFTPHRRAARRLRPGVQGQPAAAHAPPTSPRSRPGSADGTIDAIATDHAPHPPEAKEAPLDQAPPGMLGLETALALALAELDMPLGRRRRRAVSWKPAAIAGVADRHGRPDRPSASRPTSSSSTPSAGVGGGARPAGEQEPQHAVRGPHRARQGPPHDLRRHPRRRRRRRPTLVRDGLRNREDLGAVVGDDDGVLGVRGQ